MCGRLAVGSIAPVFRVDRRRRAVAPRRRRSLPAVISPRHPPADAIERYRLDRLDTPSTAEPAPTPPDGFHHDTWSTPLGSGTTTFERAREGIAAWVVQRHSGVEVHPTDAPMAEGT